MKEKKQIGLKTLYYNHVKKEDYFKEVDRLFNEGKIIHSVTPEYGMLKIEFYPYVDFYNSFTL